MIKRIFLPLLFMLVTPVLAYATSPGAGFTLQGAYFNTSCGDFLLDSLEECDSGGVNTSSCDSDCTFAACGDGYVNTAAGEQCDGEDCCTNCILDSNGTDCTDDGNVCTTDKYNGVSAACQHANKADQTACTTDGIICTADRCVSGVCTHDQVNSGAECRAAVNSCDDPETCSTTTCPAAHNDCDTACSTCSGSTCSDKSFSGTLGTPAQSGSGVTWNDVTNATSTNLNNNASITSAGESKYLYLYLTNAGASSACVVTEATISFQGKKGGGSSSNVISYLSGAGASSTPGTSLTNSWASYGTTFNDAAISDAVTYGSGVQIGLKMTYADNTCRVYNVTGSFKTGTK